jgi:predicted nucleotidyltransferase component of viral defense system
MQIFKQELLKEARSKGYKPEILEKVYRLLDIFKQLLTIEYLKDRLALKGGTALNLFYFDKLPRLSVDSVPRKHQRC